MTRIDDLSARAAVRHGREACARHYMSITGGSREEADTFYESVRAFCSASRIIVRMPIYGVVSLLGAGYARQDESTRSRQALNALGLKDGIVAAVSRRPVSNDAGDCSVTLDGIADAFLVCGGTERLRDPARADFEPDPSNICYALRDIADCRAATSILALGKRDLLGGPLDAFANIASEGREYGTCEAVILSPLKPSNVLRVSAPDKATAKRVRRYLDSIGRAVAVDIVPEDALPFRVVDPGFSPANAMERPSQLIRQLHFAVGDRVATKRNMTAPDAVGTITDISNGGVTVEWDGAAGRGIYDMSEALMRFMAAPVRKQQMYGTVVYGLPGMDSETVRTLSSVGVDPVSLYSLITHSRPASTAAENWRDQVLDGMSVLGINGDFVSGYAAAGAGQGAPTEASEAWKEAFVPREWFEGTLPDGERLIIDVGDGRLVVAAGPNEDYLVPRPRTREEE